MHQQPVEVEHAFVERIVGLELNGAAFLAIPHARLHCVLQQILFILQLLHGVLRRGLSDLSGPVTCTGPRGSQFMRFGRSRSNSAVADQLCALKRNVDRPFDLPDVEVQNDRKDQQSTRAGFRRFHQCRQRDGFAER